MGIYTDDEVLSLAAAVEKHTRHPIASAIIKEADTLNLELPSTSGHLTEPGYGALAEVGGKIVAVGLFDWVHECCERKFHKNAPSESLPAGLAMLEKQLSRILINKLGSTSVSESKTTVYVGMEGVGIIGAIAVTDNLREDAKLTIQRCLFYHTNACILRFL